MNALPTFPTLPPYIQRYLESQRDYDRTRWPEWKYAGIADLLLEVGLVFKRGPLPASNHWSRKRQACFANAYYNVATDPNRYTYCEGLCWDSTMLVPFQHAWFVDCSDPRVALDSTLPRKGTFGYLGLPLRYAVVTKLFMSTMVVRSVLLSPEMGYPIFRGELPISGVLGDHNV